MTTDPGYSQASWNRNDESDDESRAAVCENYEGAQKSCTEIQCLVNRKIKARIFICGSRSERAISTIMIIFCFAALNKLIIKYYLSLLLFKFEISFYTITEGHLLLVGIIFNQRYVFKNSCNFSFLENIKWGW